MALLKAVGKALWNNKFNAGFGAWAGVSTYQDDIEQGSSTLGALAHAGVEAALPLLSMPLYFGYEIATGAPAELMKGYDAADQWRRRVARENANVAFQSAHFDDTQQTYTMRQRGMAIAQRGRYNMKQAMMGNEAKYMMR